MLSMLKIITLYQNFGKWKNGVFRNPKMSMGGMIKI